MSGELTATQKREANAALYERFGMMPVGHKEANALMCELITRDEQRSISDDLHKRMEQRIRDLGGVWPPMIKKCALHDCSVEFEIKTKHKRDYCTNAHAHKASVRKGREASRSPREDRNQ